MRRRKWISPRDLQYVVGFAIIATLITSGVAYGILNPPPSEPFFAMWILGSGGLAEHYYPRDDPNLMIGEDVNWTLGVYNHMGSIQYVVVRVKLLNSTLASPDELTGTPSPVSSILEYTRVLVDNETWSIPFLWKILNLTTTGERVAITGLLVNQYAIGGVVATAVSGFNYRFVFELWFYDPAKDDLSYSWRTGDSIHCVWTQIWFNATATSLA